jgi:hypothetical protein
VTTRLENWGGWTHNDYNDLFGIIPITPDYQYTVHPDGSCDRDLAQRADDCRFCNRNHVRVLHGNSSYLVGDAHHDFTVWCGGPESGFGRRGEFNGYTPLVGARVTSIHITGGEATVRVDTDRGAGTVRFFDADGWRLLVDVA